VSAGTLQVGQGGALGSASIASGAQLSFARGDSFTYAGSTTGLGSVAISGGGDLTITGALGHDGGTNIATGQTLTMGTGSSIGGLGALTVQVKVRYTDCTTLTRQIRLEEPVVTASEIYRLSCYLLARHRLVTSPLRLLGIGVSTLTDPSHPQLKLPI
jgi:hypothetical protein